VAPRQTSSASSVRQTKRQAVAAIEPIEFPRNLDQSNRQRRRQDESQTPGIFRQHSNAHTAGDAGQAQKLEKGLLQMNPRHVQTQAPSVEWIVGGGSCQQWNPRRENRLDALRKSSTRKNQRKNPAAGISARARHQRQRPAQKFSLSLGLPKQRRA
jgi:hypothetical protein